MSNINVSIIIVSYNTSAFIVDCIRSILSETHQINYEIIVLDNHSQDDSIAVIKENFPSVTVLEESTNHGFAKGNNIAVGHAKGQYILLLNPDTLVINQSIDTLFEFVETQINDTISGGMTYYSDGSINPTSCWKHQSIWSLFCFATGLSTFFKYSPYFDPESYGFITDKTPVVVEIVSGGFCMLKKSTWDSLNGFSEEFFMYGEDADLNIRAAEIGVISMIYPNARVIHHGSMSDTVESEKIIKLYKSKLLVIKKHWKSGFAIRVAESLYFLGVGIRAKSQFWKTNKSIKSVVWSEVFRRRSEWLSSND